MKFNESGVIALFTQELRKAMVQHPRWPTDPVHAAAIVAEEAGELTQKSLHITYEEGFEVELVDEAIQTGAMAMRFLLNVHRYRMRPSPQEDDS